MTAPNLAVLPDLALLGFYFPPLALWAGLALLVFIALRWLLGQVGFYGLVWHRSLFNVALYVVLLGAVMFLGNSTWP